MARTPLRSEIPTLGEIARPVAVLSAPVIVILGVLVLGAGLAVVPGVAAAIAAVIAIAVLVRRHMGDLNAVGDYTEALAGNAEALAPQVGAAGPARRLVAAIGRLRRSDFAAPAQGLLETGGAGLDSLPDPILMLSEDRHVVRANAAARQLLGPTLTGRDLATVLRNPALLQAVDQVLHGENDAEVEFSFHVPVERNFSARIARLPAAAPDGACMVIALRDLTAMKRAEQMRSDFIANASHELRTPISVLLGCIQTLRGSARDDPEAQAEFFGLMQTQAERMSRLVDDLLSLSRIELNEHTLPSEQVDVPRIVRQVVEALAFNAQARGIRIETDFAGELPTIPGDPDELAQVFQNLIDNAVKYGAEDSIVRITARVARDDIPPSLPGESACLAIAIRDQGDGIPPEHLPRLTERFYRVDTARSRELGGTGLGLAIVKHVVNRHRGALTIDSEQGAGSIFTVFLPAAAGESVTAAA